MHMRDGEKVMPLIKGADGRWGVQAPAFPLTTEITIRILPSAKVTITEQVDAEGRRSLWMEIHDA